MVTSLEKLVAEIVRSVKVEIVVDTNKRTIQEEFDDLEEALRWIKNFLEIE